MREQKYSKMHVRQQKYNKMHDAQKSYSKKCTTRRLTVAIYCNLAKLIFTVVLQGPCCYCTSDANFNGCIHLL